MNSKGIDNSMGHLSTVDINFTIVAARWNAAIVDRLIAGAEKMLFSKGIKRQQIEVFRVPGAFEIPLACQVAALRNSCNAVIALGAVIRGATPHFEFVAGECVRGVGEVAIKIGKPVALGVLTADTIDQAIERSEDDENNKGAEAAMSAIEMVNLLQVCKT